MDLDVIRYKCNKNLNKAKTTNYRLIRTNPMLLFKKSVCYQKLSSRFNTYKPIDRSKAKIIMIVPDLARGQMMQRYEMIGIDNWQATYQPNQSNAGLNNTNNDRYNPKAGETQGLPFTEDRSNVAPRQVPSSAGMKPRKKEWRCAESYIDREIILLVRGTYLYPRLILLVEFV